MEVGELWHVPVGGMEEVHLPTYVTTYFLHAAGETTAPAIQDPFQTIRN